ncbi:sulfatase-like hydrolase/transferase [Desertihabitans aurantiacus]|uniref:sulfatase-like hydrolase/transferase n=1 Tax=Desertihabitans aurantiacus TaxID=2282477 RepID=UPI001E29886C|nr:sulfatase-like hydrolase/transferase [Desertihabitans aurantiacus]
MAPNGADPAAGRPDVLLVMTDQHRAGLTRRGGYPLDTMPFLDGLAATGTDLVNAYTPHPTCVPARTSMLTGRFPSAHRVRQNSTAQHACYEADLLDVLRGAGYRLHFAGKPHIHRGPADFDSWAGPYFHTEGPQHTEQQAAFDTWLRGLDHGPSTEATPFPLEVQLPYRIVDDAVAALDQAPADQPLFSWVSFPEPHNPYQVPEPYFSMFAESDVPDRLSGPEAAEAKGGDHRWLRRLVESKRPNYDDLWRRYAANYLGMLRLIDDQLERLLAAVAARGRDTVVVVLSDHGDYVGEYGLQRKGAGLSEFLARIPMVVAGPGVAAQTRTEMVSLVDVLPTLCELLGLELPAGVQGRSLAPLLAGEPVPTGEFGSIYAEVGFGGAPYGPDEHPPLHFDYTGTSYDELNSVTMSGGRRMVRAGDWKLVMDSEGCTELYSLADDPAELVDLSDDPARTGELLALTRLLAAWMIRVGDELPTGAYRPKRLPHNWRWADRALPLPTARTSR